MIRALQLTLARYPRAYLRLLSLLGRGSTEKRAYLSVVRRGDIVFDIGANEGYFTLLFSDLAGRDGQVHAFEPLPATFEHLARRIRAERSAGNVRVVQAACSDVIGSATLVVPAGDAAQASLAAHASGSWRHDGRAQHQVDTVRLDEYVESVGCDRLDFLKCDAEGAELSILRGLGRHLERLKPLICFELCPDWTRDFGYGGSDLIEFLTQAGYDRLFVLYDSIQRATPDQVAQLAATHQSVNVIAASSQAHSSQIGRLTATAGWPAVHRS